MAGILSAASPSHLPEPVAEDQLSFHTVRRIGLIACAVFLVTVAFCILGRRGVDYSVVHALNAVARRSFVFDYAIRTLERDMFSNVLLMTVVWYAWFSRREIEVRAGMMVGVLCSFAAGVVSRGLQLALPTHLRPLHDPALHFRIPFAINPDSLNHWSSFPSDHAAVLFGLAVTVLIANRRAGYVALACATLTNLVRIYLGFHFPSDILGGAMLGIVLVMATYRLRLHPAVLRLAAATRQQSPLFYAVCFYISFGIATLFTDVRDTAAGLVHGLHAHAANTVGPQTAVPATDRLE